jgi:hypothetical protein
VQIVDSAGNTTTQECTINIVYPVPGVPALSSGTSPNTGVFSLASTQSADPLLYGSLQYTLQHRNASGEWADVSSTVTTASYAFNTLPRVNPSPSTSMSSPIVVLSPERLGVGRVGSSDVRPGNGRGGRPARVAGAIGMWQRQPEHLDTERDHIQDTERDHIQDSDRLDWLRRHDGHWQERRNKSARRERLQE